MRQRPRPAVSPPTSGGSASVGNPSRGGQTSTRRQPLHQLNEGTVVSSSSSSWEITNHSDENDDTTTTRRTTRRARSPVAPASSASRSLTPPPRSPLPRPPSSDLSPTRSPTRFALPPPPSMATSSEFGLRARPGSRSPTNPASATSSKFPLPPPPPPASSSVASRARIRPSRLRPDQEGTATGSDISSKGGLRSRVNNTANSGSPDRLRQTQQQEHYNYQGNSLSRSDSSDNSTYQSSSYAPQPQSSSNKKRQRKKSLRQQVEERRRFLERTTRLEEFHTVFRAPLHVADSRYKEYLHGQVIPRKRPSRQPPIITKDCCLRGCFGFSVVGVLFLVFVGILLDTQPLYIKGSLPTQLVQSQTTGKYVTQYILPSSSMVIVTEGDDATNNNSQQVMPYSRLPMATVAYHAAWVYFFVAALCWYARNRGWVHSRVYRYRNRYQDIPDHEDDDAYSDVDSTAPTFHMNNGGYQDLDEDGNNGRASSLPSTTSFVLSKMRHLWSVARANAAQYLAARGWYRPVQRYRRKQTPKTV